MNNVFETVGHKLPGTNINKPMQARRRGALACIAAVAVAIPVVSSFTGNPLESERVCTTTDGVASGYSGWDNATEAVYSLREKGVYLPNINTVADSFGSEDIQPVQVCINKFGNPISQNLLNNNVVVTDLP